MKRTLILFQKLVFHAGIKKVSNIGVSSLEIHFLKRISLEGSAGLAELTYTNKHFLSFKIISLFKSKWGLSFTFFKTIFFSFHVCVFP